MKKSTLGIIILVIIAAWIGFKYSDPVRQIASYEECVLHPDSVVGETNAYECMTKIGKKFVADEAYAQQRAKNQKVCPDAWFDNKMPVIGEQPVDSQYLIIDGERWEMDEININWVKDNCVITEPISVF